MRTSSEFLQHFPYLTWDFTPEVIEKRSVDIIADIKERIEKLTYLPANKIQFHTVCESLADMDVEIKRERSIIEVYFRSSPVKEVRDKCFKVGKRWSDFYAEFITRRDIYDLLTIVKFFEKSIPYESTRYLEKSLLHKKRSGVHLEADVRVKLTTLLKKISYLSQSFNKNLSQDDTKIEFVKEDLLGMPETFFTGLEVKDGIYTLTLQNPHVVPILKQCKIVKTRKIMEKAHNSRCIDQNVTILEKILELRNEVSKILGYQTHADFVAEILMSKSAAKINEFLTCLFEKIQNASKKEMDRLLELKKIECKEMGVPFDGKINVYDSSYYQNKVVELDYQIDKNLMKQYFPFDHVTVKLLELHESLFGIKFEEVLNPPLIHKDVFLYAVYDKATSFLIGYVYMDLFSRRGKYYTDGFYGIQPACHYKNKPQIGCAVMFANFRKPSYGRPTLLTHVEIITYFHEFGHVMHQICSKTRYSVFQ